MTRDFARSSALLLAAIVLSFTRLGREPVFILNEAREGVYARAMIAQGNWVLPRVENHVENGELIPDKPPLFHWIAAAATWLRAGLSGTAGEGSLAVARTFDESSLRAPSALAGCMTVVAILWLGARLVGSRAALLAAVALIASWQFVNQTRYGRVDMCFACCTTWAMLLCGSFLVRGRRRALVGAAAAAGLAVLAKGPLGLLLPLLACGAWAAASSIRRRSARWLLDAPWIAAALVFACVSLPWYFAAWKLGGHAFVHSQLQTENFDQFIGKNGHMPFYYYVVAWLTGSWPWNLLAVLAVREALRTRESDALFCATWWLVFLAFFQMSAYKRGAYLLPALPAGALLAGRWLDAWIERRDRARGDATERVFDRWVVAASIVGLLGAGVGAMLAGEEHLAQWIGFPIGRADAALVTGSALAALAAAVAAALAIARSSARRALAAGGSALFVLYLGGFTTVLRIQAEHVSPAPLVARVESALPADQRVRVLGVGDDPSLLLLFHAHDPSLFDVRPATEPPPRRWPLGYYLFSESAWREACDEPTRCGRAWKELFHDDLHERGHTIPVVFALHERGDAQVAE